MEHDSRQRSPGGSSGGSGRPGAGAGPVGKVSRVEQADRDPNASFSQPPPAPGTEVPDLGASGTLKHHFGTSYLAGPSGTALKVDITATMSGSNDHGDAEISSGVTKVNGGKPEGSAEFRYDNHFFTMAMTADGHMKIDKPIIMDSDGPLSWQIKEVSDGPTLSLELHATAKLHNKHGRDTTLDLGLNIDITAIKKPPRGAPEADPHPVTIPVKVLVPTLVAVGGAAALTVILEGIGLIALAA